MSDKPTLALALGDAAGIGSELAARLLLEDEVREAASLVVIGDRRQLAMGAAQAGLDPALPGLPVEPVADTPDAASKMIAGQNGTAAAEQGAGLGHRLLDTGNLDPQTIRLGEASALTGRAALENFEIALRACKSGHADATCFTPFNKYAMRLARPGYVDEIGFIQAVLETDAEGAEFNVLDELWNARVTSHVPLKDVAGYISSERVLDRIRLTDRTMRTTGIARPRIAVAALNPHAGDGGNFGHEDDDLIAPAVERARTHQIDVSGPWPSDTVYLRAFKGEFDVVLSMYHDQGQIAMKLMGFDRGVTLIGGFPFWIATPAHGTAYDIAGTGKASVNATKNAILLAARLADASDQETGVTPSRPAIVPKIESQRSTPG